MAASMACNVLRTDLLASQNEVTDDRCLTAKLDVKQSQICWSLRSGKESRSFNTLHAIESRHDSDSGPLASVNEHVPAPFREP